MMSFALTVRDSVPHVSIGGAAVGTWAVARMNVKVVDLPPFRVLDPPTLVWNQLASYTVTWTTSANITSIAPTVDVLLSLDGGQSFSVEEGLRSAVLQGDDILKNLPSKTNPRRSYFPLPVGGFLGPERPGAG